MATKKKPDDELKIRRAGVTARTNLTLSKANIAAVRELAPGQPLSLVVDEALGEWIERQRAGGEVTGVTAPVPSAGHPRRAPSDELPPAPEPEEQTP